MSDYEDKYSQMEKEIDHPLEDLLDIESGTTIVEYEEREPTILVEHEAYDEKDHEIEEQFQEVYDLAISAYTNSSDRNEGIEPKYRARNEEVAMSYLTIALSAARDKSHMKSQKDRTEKMASKQGTTTNNNLIVDRETLLNMLEGPDDEQDALDAEYVEEKDDN